MISYWPSYSPDLGPVTGLIRNHLINNIIVLNVSQSSSEDPDQIVQICRQIRVFALPQYPEGTILYGGSFDNCMSQPLLRANKMCDDTWLTNVCYGL